MKASLRALFLTIALAGASAAAAETPATARLVSCGKTDCVLVRGYRASAEAAVAINGHAVAVEGGRAWRLRLPVETVRDWSMPFARALDVAVAGTAGSPEMHDAARLPTGLLAGRIELAELVVRAR